MSDLLTDEQISSNMKKFPEWELEDKEITRLIEFETFPEAIDFVSDLAEVAEKAYHHPDIDIRYNKVVLHLSTHSEGGLTEADFDMAKRIENMLA